MQGPGTQKQPLLPIDLSSAGWFLLAAGIWELLFNRLSSALGIYANAGAEDFLGLLATSGRFAMNATGIMALCLACAILPRMAANPRFASFSLRVILMLTSPFYLPLICVSVFHQIDDRYVLLGYLITTGVVVLITILTFVHKISGNTRRVILVLGAIELLAAAEMICRLILLYHPLDSIEVLAKRTYLFAEGLFVVLPIFAFFTLRPGRIASFVRRPHLLALLWAAATAVVAAFTAFQIKNTFVLSVIAYRVLGLKLSIPGTAPLYVAALFFGTLLVGSLILPSKRWPPDRRSRRIGTGLGCIWLAGIQPTHPYQFILMLTGFLYLSRGLLDDVLEASASQIPALAPVAQSDDASKM